MKTVYVLVPVLQSGAVIAKRGDMLEVPGQVSEAQAKIWIDAGHVGPKPPADEAPVSAPPSPAVVDEVPHVGADTVTGAPVPQQA